MLLKLQNLLGIRRCSLKKIAVALFHECYSQENRVYLNSLKRSSINMKYYEKRRHCYIHSLASQDREKQNKQVYT